MGVAQRGGPDGFGLDDTQHVHGSPAGSHQAGQQGLAHPPATDDLQLYGHGPDLTHSVPSKFLAELSVRAGLRTPHSEHAGHMRTRHRFALLLIAGLLLSSIASFAGVGPASAAAPPISPGVQTFTGGGQCTANFVFTSGGQNYLGQAAHCSGQSGSTSTNGCNQSPAPLPIGTAVEIVGFDGVSYSGTLAYSSWNTMLATPAVEDANTCQYNDFALVRINAPASLVTGTMPYWGGPTGTRPSGQACSGRVYTYGNSGLRGGVSQLSPKTGTCLSSGAGGWNHTIYTATPGIPGDSGSAVLDSTGRALGVLVTVAVAPFAGSNGITDLGRATDYARANGFGDLTLTTGGPFTPGV